MNLLIKPLAWLYKAHCGPAPVCLPPHLLPPVTHTLCAATPLAENHGPSLCRGLFVWGVPSASRSAFSLSACLPLSYLSLKTQLKSHPLLCVCVGGGKHFPHDSFALSFHLRFCLAVSPQAFWGLGQNHVLCVSVPQCSMLYVETAGTQYMLGTWMFVEAIHP